MGVDIPDNFSTVSYTHLDVYKRQIITTVKQGLLGGLGVEAIAGFSCAGKLSSLLMMPVFGFVPVSYTHLLMSVSPRPTNTRWSACGSSLQTTPM